MYVFLHPQLSFGISDLSAEIHLKGRKKGREYFQCDVFNIFSSKINIHTRILEMNVIAIPESPINPENPKHLEFSKIDFLLIILWPAKTKIKTKFNSLGTQPNC